MQHTFYFIQDSVFDLWNEDKLNSKKQYYDYDIVGTSFKYSYTFPFSDTWHVVLQNDNPGSGANVTVRTIINKI
ncbi:hypothetical protein LCGC14_1661610 [marine sediment metagenome]|uniref:Uncharacterized protein n=1 Tax=marine sediment metagenome TaxID=412755 RepID=A0A0F9HUK2_9ZZZZ